MVKIRLKGKTKLNAIAGIILTLLLTSTLTVAFTSPLIVANTSTELSQASSIIQEADGEGLSNPTDSRDSFSYNDFKNYNLVQNAPAEQDPKPCSVDEDKWNFNKTNEWADFANVDGNSAELVIGVNNAKPNSYAEIMRLTSEKDGELVNTVSMEDEIWAVVVDIPSVAVSSLVTEVKVAGLSRYIEPNMKFQASFIPNDHYWPLQWGPAKIGADYAWNTTMGDHSVLVTVIDTGIDWNHPDLAANYVPLGYDWVNNDPDPMDDHGHGTHCAGIIAAEINNSIGIAGLAQVRIMAEKGLNWAGWGTEDDLAKAIIHAVDQGADILSLSWGSYAESTLIHEAIKYAYDQGVLVVAAAGNDATSVKLFPAAFNEVIAVSATQEDDSPVWWTNFGDWIELAAPGVNIYSTVWDDSYTYMSGTSMATPHVAGVAALIWSCFPNMSRDWVRLWLRYTADDLGDPGFDDYYGYGRINARKGIEQFPPDHDLIIASWEKPSYVEPGGEGTVSTTVLNFGAHNETSITVKLFVNGSIVDSASISFLAIGTSATVNCSWSPTVEGIYNVTSYVVPVPGETITENNVVWAYVYVGVPVKAFVLESAGTYYADIISNWQVLNTNWYVYGKTMIQIDYTTLNIGDITYEDIAATGADVLIISCAYNPWRGWEFTNSEIEAITRYVKEGHGLITTAGTFYYSAPNNNKLASLFGLNETVAWEYVGTDLLHPVDPTHPFFVNVPNPYTFQYVGTAVPSDWQWDENELTGGTYVALGHYEECAIVTYRGLAYISPWLEIIPPYYHFHLQLLYNAITWSRYQKPEHELVVSLEHPLNLEPGESTLLNGTVSNMGLNNEPNVELQLLINGAPVNSTIIPKLSTGASYVINYWWTPMAEAAYNVAAYAPPLPGEEFTLNNVNSAIVYVRFRRFVLWDDVHDADGDSLTGNYLELYELLNASEFIVDELTSGTINIGLLAHYNILVLMDPDLDFSSSEIRDIQNWVAAGGALLIIPDGGYPPTINTLMSPYGVQMTGRFGGYGITTNIVSHPVTQGVSSIYVDLVQEISVKPPSITLAWTTEPYAFLSITGGGEVVVLSDSNIMDNPRLGMADNTQLMLNIFNWIGVKYEHDLAVTLDAPTFLEPDGSSLLNATVQNIGLSNETSVDLFLLINGTVVNSTMVLELLTGASYTINYLWSKPSVGVTYNVTAYAPPEPGENVTANNFVCKMVRICYITVALISDQSELLTITSILDSMGVGYDVYNDNGIYLYTEDLDLLLRYQTVIFYKEYRYITLNEYTALENYLSSGGNLLVTGLDSLVSDNRLRDIIRSATMGDNVEEPDLRVVKETHPIMNGSYGTFLAGYLISGLYSDCDAVEANITRNAVTVAELRDGYDKIIATQGIPGKVVFWNGRGDYDWVQNRDCKAMLKNTLAWFAAPFISRDVAIVSIATSATEVYEGQIVNVTVAVKNQGKVTETFNVTAYYDTSVIGMQTVTNLTAGEKVTLTFSWDTKGVKLYITQAIKAIASAVPDEIDTTDNILIDGTVRVKMVGDVNGDGIVDLFDVTKAAASFGSRPGDPDWNSEVDFKSDGLIDIFDFVMMGVNFGREHIPPMERTTVYVFPQSTAATVGSTFTINVNIYNVTDLYGFEFHLGYDTTILDIVKVEVKPFLNEPTFVATNKVNEGEGWYWLAIASLSPAKPKNGSGTLVTITFKVTGIGNCVLDLYNTKLADAKGRPIDHDVKDGYVAVIS